MNRSVSAKQSNPILRLRKKHAPGRHAPPNIADGERLLNTQSLRHAAIAGLLIIITFAVVWSMLSVALSRVFPWLTLLLGFLVGHAVRRGGQGLDWRFPALAAVLTAFGAIAGNVAVAAAFTAADYGVSTLTILRAVTTMTWPVFFAEVMTVADVIFTAASALIAALLANRRLNREEYQALRIFQDHLAKGDNTE